LTRAGRTAAHGALLASDEAAVVATVDGRPIPVSRLEARLAEVRRGPRGRHMPPENATGSVTMRRWIVQELVTEEVLRLEARRAGVEDDESLGTSGTSMTRLVDLVTGSVSVPESEIRAYYERNLDLYRRPEVRRVRHILLADEAASHEVLRRLEAGEPMDEIARMASTDPGSRQDGGYLGAVRRGELAGPLEDALFAAEVGAIVGPCKTEHGWHVARVEGVVPRTTVPYVDVREAIKDELLAAARGRAFEAWLEGRRRALAVVEPDFAHPADPVHGVPSHRH
jgi:[acyl-carrier-protein] S-malonyltransferase